MAKRLQTLFAFWGSSSVTQSTSPVVSRTSETEESAPPSVTNSRPYVSERVNNKSFGSRKSFPSAPVTFPLIYSFMSSLSLIGYQMSNVYSTDMEFSSVVGRELGTSLGELDGRLDGDSLGKDDGACEIEGWREGWELGVWLGRELEEGDDEGKDVGIVVIVGEVDVDGVTEGDEDGTDEIDGLELTEGICVGDHEGDSDGIDDGATEIDGAFVGCLVGSPFFVTVVPLMLVALANGPPPPAFATKFSVNASRSSAPIRGKRTISLMVGSESPPPPVVRSISNV